VPYVRVKAQVQFVKSVLSNHIFKKRVFQEELKEAALRYGLNVWMEDEEMVD